MLVATDVVEQVTHVAEQYFVSQLLNPLFSAVIDRISRNHDFDDGGFSSHADLLLRRSSIATSLPESAIKILYTLRSFL